MNPKELLAHPEQSLVDHLTGVARRARQFAAHFQGESQAELAGLLHDLGKAEESFQARMKAIRSTGKDTGKKERHAHHGAALALTHQVWPVAFAINGHHAGLQNRSDLQNLSSNWTRQASECEAKLRGGDAWVHHSWPISDFGKTLPVWLDRISFTSATEREAKMRAVDFYTRMLFSALVDADRLDTEEASQAESSGANARKRRGWRFGARGLAAKVQANGNELEAAEPLLAMLDQAIAERVACARSKHASEAVMTVRAEVLAACKTAAASDRGVFTLKVPTGGGKTLASVAFGLHHVAHHNKGLPEEDPRRLRRIIVVVPYLNIIQQTVRICAWSSGTSYGRRMPLTQ